MAARICTCRFYWVAIDPAVEVVRLRDPDEFCTAVHTEAATAHRQAENAGLADQAPQI